MTREDIKGMIDDCLNVLHIPKSRGGPGFSEWETGFVESIADQFEERGALTRKQIEKLEAVWNKI